MLFSHKSILIEPFSHKIFGRASKFSYFCYWCHIDNALYILRVVCLIYSDAITLSTNWETLSGLWTMQKVDAMMNKNSKKIRINFEMVGWLFNFAYHFIGFCSLSGYFSSSSSSPFILHRNDHQCIILCKAKVTKWNQSPERVQFKWIIAIFSSFFLGYDTWVCVKMQ